MKITGLTEKQGAVLTAIRELGGDVTPDQIADYSGVNPNTVKGYVRRFEKEGAVVRNRYGKYSLPDQVGQVVTADTPSSDIQADTLGNAGIIITDSASGKIWFTIEFPEWMRVAHPYEVNVSPMVDADNLELKNITDTDT